MKLPYQTLLTRWWAIGIVLAVLMLCFSLFNHAQATKYTTIVSIRCFTDTSAARAYLDEAQKQKVEGVHIWGTQTGTGQVCFAMDKASGNQPSLAWELVR